MAILASVPVVLLIATVELQELLVVVVEVIRRLRKLFGKRATEVLAVFLESFDGRKLRGRCILFIRHGNDLDGDGGTPRAEYRSMTTVLMIIVKIRDGAESKTRKVSPETLLPSEPEA
jgi:hypothetical protein